MVQVKFTKKQLQALKEQLDYDLFIAMLDWPDDRDTKRLRRLLYTIQERITAILEGGNTNAK